jgi:hypothetical protein
LISWLGLPYIPKREFHPEGRVAKAKDTAELVLRRPDDVEALGAYLRSRRRGIGMPVAKEAAPYMGVGLRLLVQLESGARGKRGVTLAKLLRILEGLGLEMAIRPRTAASTRPTRS